MLTAKQLEAFLFIREFMHQEDVAPTYNEIAEALGQKSKSGVHRLLHGLAERGFIRVIPHRARAIEILRDLPGVASPQVRQSVQVRHIADFTDSQGEYGRVCNLLREVHDGYLYRTSCSPNSIVGRVRAELGLPLKPTQ